MRTIKKKQLCFQLSPNIFYMVCFVLLDPGWFAEMCDINFFQLIPTHFKKVRK